MLSGLQANFIKRVLTAQPHIQIIPPDEIARQLRMMPELVEGAIVQRPSQRILSIDQWQTIRATMKSRPDVVTVTPTASGSALAIRGDAARSISLTGVEPDLYFQIVRVPDYIVMGTSKRDSDEILI